MPNPTRHSPFRTLYVVTIAVVTAALLAAVAPVFAQSSDQEPVITLKVKGMPIQEVLKLIAAKGNMSLAVGPGVGGTVTLFVEDLPIRAALNLAVDLADVAYRIQEGVIRVMTHDDYADTYGESFQELRETRVVQLEHSPGQAIVPILAPLRGRSGQVIMHPQSGSIVIHDAPHRIDRMVEVIRSLDHALTEPIQTRTIPLDYASPDSILPYLRNLMTPEVGSITYDTRSGMLALTDFAARLDAVASRIELLDVPTKQVLIEARIVQLSMDDEIKTGINWQVVEEELNHLRVTGDFPILADTNDGLRAWHGDPDSDVYNSMIEALETYGSTDLLSSPRIRVANGETAEILVGSKVPYKTIDTRLDANGIETRFEKVTVIEVGVQLEVDTRIHSDGLISMFVRPEVSSVTGFVDDIPVVETSTMESRIIAEDGHTVVLGGLNRNEIRTERKGLPLLSRIPLLGWFFGSTSREVVRTELVIFLTPRIVTAGGE